MSEFDVVHVISGERPKTLVEAVGWPLLPVTHEQRHSADSPVAGKSALVLLVRSRMIAGLMATSFSH